jgi:hypothetical protein
MALVERLMHVDPDITRYIAVHEFFSSITEILYGNLTQVQVQNYYGMTAADLVDWNALAAQFPSTTANKALYCEHIHAAFILAESRVPTYSTPAEVRTRLGI